MPDLPPLYPLKFEPIYKPKVWGGRSLEKLGRELPEGQKIGESWELVDLGTTSVSGGGGGAERSRIANGPLRGKTLAAVIDAYGEALLGDLPLNQTTAGAGEFPLLVKYLDAQENLSVQVHPSPEYAAEHADAFLKSEAWYIVDCEPGSVIYKGIKEGVTPEQLAAAIERNKDEDVVPLLVSVPVKPGDCHYLPSGTCHALGGGILVAEVQTPSDTTYRVYDWGRPRKAGRELHVKQAMACIDFGPAQTEAYELRHEVKGKLGTRTSLVQCEYFRIQRLHADQAAHEALLLNQPEVWMVLQGKGSITTEDEKTGASSTVTFGPGDTLYLPPNLPGAKADLAGGTTWLEVSFPQTRGNQLA